MAYVIEPARGDDLAKLAQVEIAANALFAGLLWVACEPAGESVGFALLEIVDGDAHLEEIDVHPAHGRRGVGRALLDAVVAWAERAGLRAVTLTTFRDVPWNAPFYARAGFRTLAPHELGPGLAGLVRDEGARGLDPAQRVAMRRDLAGGRPSG